MEAKIISIYSNKGGVGKTFLSVNTATTLAKAGYETLLMELNFQTGQDIDKMLNLRPRYALVNLLPQMNAKANPKIIKKAVSPHPFGVDYLPAILNTKQISHVKPKEISSFFQKARQIYDYIIIDAGRSFSEAVVNVLQNSNLILLIATPDDLTIHKLKWCLEMFKNMHLPKEMFKLVLNRAGSSGAMDWQEVKDKLDLDIFAQIPSDGKTVGNALNRSVPCVLDSPKTQVAKALVEFSKKLENEDIFIEPGDIKKFKMSGSINKPTSNIWKKMGIFETAQGDTLEFDEEDEEIALKKKIHEKTCSSNEYR